MHPHSTQLDLDGYRQLADWAWAAGLFEGEGCISIPSLATLHRQPSTKVVLYLGMTDEDVVRRFGAIVGGGTVRIRDRSLVKPHYKPVVIWRARASNVGPILRQFLPWLGARRRAKAEEALAFLRAARPTEGRRTHCPYGHPYDAENTRVYRGHRYCRACDRARSKERRSRLANR